MSIGKHCWRVVPLCFEKLMYHGHVTHFGREGEGLGVVGLGMGLGLCLGGFGCLAWFRSSWGSCCCALKT